MRIACLAATLAHLASAQPNPLAAANEALSRLAERSAPSVVLVVSNAYRPLAGDDGDESEAVALRQSAGSGAIISPEGLILTNAHVVAGSTRVQVHLPPPAGRPGSSIVRPPGRVLSARILGSDAETDLALLKIEGSQLPALSFADSDRVRQGQMVIAFGNPRGLEGSMSTGVVSAVGRQLKPDDRLVYLQTDAAINPGNSGGPLLDIDGNIVGINTMILSTTGSSSGLGFAVPSNIARYVAAELKEHGTVKRGDIGVEGQTITPGIASALGLAAGQGVVLADVRPKGPADIAGLRIGDVVLAIDGKQVENARQFHVNLYQRHSPAITELEILRGTGKRSLRVVVLDRPDDPVRFASLVNDGEHLVSRLQVLAISLEPRILDLLPGLRRSYGILVAAHAAGPRLQAGLLERGDAIYAVNGQPVSTLPELRDLIGKPAAGETVVLQIERKGKIRYLEVVVD